MRKEPWHSWWELFATWKAKRVQKRKCKGWASDPAQAGMGPVSSHKKSNIHHSILAGARASQHWPEPSSQTEFRRSLSFSSLCKCESVHTIPTQGQMEWMRPALGHYPVSLTLSLGQSISLSMHLQLPFFTKTFGVTQGQSSSLFPELPHSSPRTITSPQQLDTAKTTKQKGIDRQLVTHQLAGRFGITRTSGVPEHPPGWLGHPYLEPSAVLMDSNQGHRATKIY